MSDSNIPRRCYRQKWTPAEKAIKDAVEAVEIVGAHPLLTEAVILLQKAFDKLADYTDGNTSELDQKAV